MNEFLYLVGMASLHSVFSLIRQERISMKRIVFCSLFLLLHASSSNSQPIIFSHPLSPRIANYTISVSLDANKKMLRGKETLVWRNDSKGAISDLQFHLYLNAFKSAQTSFMQESGRKPMNSTDVTMGWIEVKKMVVRDGEDLTNKIEFIHPDDDNVNDQTVIRVPLKKLIKRGKSITLDIEFESQLPTIFARTGFHKNFFMVAQWFPKIGVYESLVDKKAKGAWNCHQFHANTEFFADYGVYDVDMTVPKNYVLGATGIMVRETKAGDSTKTVSYHAEDVHDFAWTASPDFAVVEDQWNNVHIRLLTQPYKVGNISERYIHSVKSAMARFHDWVGVYPYPNLTIVDPPMNASEACGMEYPTLITGESVWGLPNGVRLEELATIHEFGHQYWYGMVGNNEFEEAWLDEGINTYYETRIMNDTYGEKNSVLDLFGFTVGDFDFSRSGYVGARNPKLAPTLLPAWKYDAGGYGEFTYNKSATFLTTLERLVGKPVMDTIMRTYFDRWKFKHPHSADFIAVANEVVPRFHGKKFGENMNWFFDQFLSGTNVCDYELSSISVSEIGEPAMRGKNQGMEYESRILASRLGEVQMPVDVLMRFDDGKEIRESWDGQARYKLFVYKGKARIVSAIVDPDHVLAIDINYNNNSKSFTPPVFPVWKYTVKFMIAVQTLLQSLILF
jgi:Peptidase family M1 domain